MRCTGETGEIGADFTGEYQCGINAHGRDGRQINTHHVIQRLMQGRLLSHGAVWVAQRLDRIGRLIGQAR